MTGNRDVRLSVVSGVTWGIIFAQSCDKKAIGESWLFCSFLGIIVNS
jgi:hypothetical protein